tara:strand:- start:197 stop:388 length:192 start_codon:yes stop_codon:yes gene_type:complete
MKKTRMKNINDTILLDLERAIKEKRYEQRQANKNHDFTTACWCQNELYELYDQYEKVERMITA